jgi:DNA-binding transcriptional ArsR family regulator
MRALAHPTRVRMMHLLRSESLSASELARRLGIRFGSAQFHLRSLERAGIAGKVATRAKRGGTEVLYSVPHNLWVDIEADAPRGMRQTMNRAYVAELLRGLDASAEHPEPEDTNRDILSTRELELRPEDLPAAAEAVRELIRRVEALAVDTPTDDSIPFAVSLFFFRVPREASQHPNGPARNGA